MTDNTNAPEPDADRSPWSRPGFIAAAAFVAVLLVLGTVVTVGALRKDDEPAPINTPTSTATEAATTPPAATEADSVCGLGGVELDGTVTDAPAAEWAFEGTTAYPTSNTYGPGETTSNGIRTCFQHSPTGALFMAANAVAQGSGANSAEWAATAMAEGPFRADLLSQSQSASSGGDARVEIGGFRLLSYTGASARVDLGYTTFQGGQVVSISGIYELVWQAGDWKISTDVAEPLTVEAIANLSGYTPWVP